MATLPLLSPVGGPLGGPVTPNRALPSIVPLSPGSPLSLWRPIIPSFSLADIPEDASEDDLSTPASPASHSSSYTPTPVPSIFREDSTPHPIRPHLSSTPPLPSLAHLPHVWLNELRVSDNSHSQANPAQRKKGGCKAVQISVRVGATVHLVHGKCDVRKSFSNRSFSKYYDRGHFAVVGVEDTGGTVLVVEEAKRGRDGKHFVAMEKSCTPPYAAEDGNPRHPLLAFAADAVYRLTVATREEGEVRVEVKCLFEQGSATVSRKGRVGCGDGAESLRKRGRDEDDGDDEWKDGTKRMRSLPAVFIDRPLSSASSSSASLSSMSSVGEGAAESPCPTLSPAPSSPESEVSSLCSSPLPLFLSVTEAAAVDVFALDDGPAVSVMGSVAGVGQWPSPAMWGVAASWLSPFASPMGPRGVGELKESGGSPYTGWMDGVMVDMPELVLR